jgi:hypothetical protein
MAKGKRTLNRMAMRADFEEEERRGDEEEDRDEEEEEDDDEEEGEEDEEPSEEDEEGAGDDDEEAPKKPKKKKKVVKEVKPKKSRARAAKVVRMRVVWGVFNNSNNMVASYEYPRKSEAEAHAARLIAEKRSTHFVQPVKEPMEEKKEDKK